MPGGHRGRIGNYFRAEKLYNSGAVGGLKQKCNIVKRGAYGPRTSCLLPVSLYPDFVALPEPEFARGFWWRGKILHRPARSGLAAKIVDASRAELLVVHYSGGTPRRRCRWFCAKMELAR